MSDAAEATSGGGKKMMIMMGVVVIVEAVLIVGAMQVLMPSSSSAKEESVSAEVPEGERIVEVRVLDARLPNAKTGVEYLYDTQIYVQVREKHQARVTEELDRFQFEIKAELTAIWRESDPPHFKEPRLATLTRKVESLLTDRFDHDVETGEPIVLKTIIVMGTGFRAGS